MRDEGQGGGEEEAGEREREEEGLCSQRGRHPAGRTRVMTDVTDGEVRTAGVL